MARFPTPDQILQAFRDEGLAVYEMPGWRGRCRCCSGPHDPAARSYIRSWREWFGITWHMTYGARLSGQAAVDYTQRILVGGNGSVPGPLCLAGIDGDGRLLMVSAGRANHIGSISQASLQAMQRASFSLSGSQNLRGSGVDGNAYTLGFEALGANSPNPAQYDTLVRASAALSRLNGWSGQEVHGHGECSSQRTFTDPGCDMGKARRDVMARLSSGTPQPRPQPQARYVRPVPQGVTAAYRKPGSWQLGYHTGIDFGSPVGTPVRAVAEGDVRARSTFGPDYGLTVTVNEDDNSGGEGAGSDWTYCHLSEIHVTPGQRVRAGDVLGLTGNTGRSSGPHLHLERRPRMGGYGSDLNPVLWTTPTPTPTPLEDDVPEYRETRTVLKHAGNNSWALPDDAARLVLPKDVPQRFAVRALLTAPEHVVLHTRWVSLWNGKWVRYGITRHPVSNGVETAFFGGQAAPHADLRLDVWADQPCEIGIDFSGLIWDVR